MKKLFFLFCFLAFFFNSFSQKQPFQRSVPGYPVKDSRLYVTENLAIPKANDTTSALHGGPDSLGLVVQIRSTGLWYIRDTTAGGHKWSLLPNIYTADGTLLGDRNVYLGTHTLNILNTTGTLGSVFNNKIFGSALGDYTQIANFGTVWLLKANGTTGTHHGTISGDSTQIAFGQTEGAYQFQFMQSSSSTSTYLPVGMDGLGNIRRMTTWPATNLSSFNLTAGRGVYATGTGLANAKFIMDTAGTALRLDDGYAFISTNGSEIFGLTNTGASYNTTPSPFTKTYLSGLIFYPTVGGTEVGIGSSTVRGGYNDLITGKGHSSYVGTAPDSLVMTVIIPQSGTQGPKIRMDSASLAITHIQTGTNAVSGDSNIIDHSGKITKVPMPIVDVQTFTAGSYTWTKPAGAKFVRVEMVSAGGGGGSGRRGAAASLRSGGGGGGGGSYGEIMLPAAAVGSTETVFVGSGGNGGNAQTTNDTDGNNGVDGGNVLFGNWLKVFGSAHGVFGNATSGNGGAATGGGYPNASSYSGGVGGTGSGSTGGAGGSGSRGAPGGGSGGGLSAGDVVAFGGTGGAWGVGNAAGPNSIVGGSGGPSSGANGADGVMTNVNAALGGPGAGGGAASKTANAGNGGAGVCYGCGGGGGGASLNGFSSGAGGRGGDGIVIVITYF